MSEWRDILYDASRKKKSRSYCSLCAMRKITSIMILRAIAAVILIMTCLILSRPKNWRTSFFCRKKKVSLLARARLECDIDLNHWTQKDRRNISEILPSISNQFVDACAHFFETNKFYTFNFGYDMTSRVDLRFIDEVQQIASFLRVLLYFWNWNLEEKKITWTEIRKKSHFIRSVW